ncbi:MAG: hypothetical protein JO170_28725 [Verrucomicrobia bacterium]|nr:hypothetical protein [Verrucomicrobiota bacterium]
MPKRILANRINVTDSASIAMSQMRGRAEQYTIKLLRACEEPVIALIKMK